MYKKTLIIISLYLTCYMFVYGIDDNTSAISFSLSDQKLPVDYAGYTLGQAGDALFIAGGVGEAAKNVYILPPGEMEWQKKSLPQGFSFGFGVSFGDKVIVIGGITDGQLTDSVQVLSYANDEFKIDTWPSLPDPRAYAGAAVMDDKLYVVGGISSIDAKQACSSVFCLDLASEEKTWEQLADIPGSGRIYPSVIGFYSELHVFGGQELVEQSNGLIARSLSDAWGYREKPLDGTTTTGWRQFTDMPTALAGAGVFQTGQTHVAIAGGFIAETPFTPVSGLMNPQVSKTVEIYHNVTDTWVAGGSLPTGAGLIYTFKRNGDTVLAGGISAHGSILSSLWDVHANKVVKQLSFCDYIVIVVYLLVMAGIGFYFATKQKSSDEFALGNRKVKWWAAAISMFATGTSSISFMAIPAQTYRTTLIWLTPVFMLIPAYFIQAYIIFPILRRLKLTSVYGYLEQRFSAPLRYVASGQCIAMQLLGRMSVVLLLPSLAISAVTGLDVCVSVLVMGLLTTIYTSVGGFEAVIWTDVVQGLLMLFGMALMIILAITGLPGGFGEFLSTGQAYDKFDFAIWSFDFKLPVIWIYIVWQLMVILSFASDQPTAQRLLSTPLKDVRKLSAMSIFYGILIAILVNMAGIAIFAYFHAHPNQLDPQMSNDEVVPLFMIQRLPTGVAGLIVAALFAASMSTLSSSMNSVATISCEDFYRKLSPKSTDKSRLIFMKVTSLVSGLIGTSVAYYMATMNLRSMFQMWGEITALVGGGFLGIYILGMFTHRTNTTGAIVGAFSSVACVLCVKYCTDFHYLWYNPLAIGSCLVVGYVVSIAIPGLPKDMKGLTVFDLAKDKIEE